MVAVMLLGRVFEGSDLIPLAGLVVYQIGDIAIFGNEAINGEGLRWGVAHGFWYLGGRWS
jgi:hypothetical protein